jgi:hypothetical protein
VTATVEALLPVLLLILLGWALRARGVVPAELWRGVELLGYWVFFPALLFETLTSSDLASLDLSAVAVTMVGAFLTMALGLIAARKPLMAALRIDGPAFSSLFQTSVRWNGFIALPIPAKLYGEAGVALVALILGLLVPFANVLAVYVVAKNAAGREPTLAETLPVVMRNPFIWATAVGLAINAGGVAFHGPLMATMNTLGAAAIGVGLLMVGAGLAASQDGSLSWAAIAGTALKLVVTPLLVIAWAMVSGLTGLAFVARMICAAVPTGMSGYVLARQMGGDAALISATSFAQTLLAFITVPLFIAVAEALK